MDGREGREIDIERSTSAFVPVGVTDVLPGSAQPAVPPSAPARAPMPPPPSPRASIPPPVPQTALAGGPDPWTRGVRDPSNDGRLNKFIFKGLTHFPRVWRFLQERPALEKLTNWGIIDFSIKKGPMRPAPLSTKAPYTSWSSLTDRTFFSRHLPPAEPLTEPAVDEVAREFLRQGEMRPSTTSTVLFSNFAQWFTDGFMRSMPDAQREPTTRTVSTHEIDLSTLYGLHEAETGDLRARQGGRLKSQLIVGEEFPPFYYDENGDRKPEFSHLPVPGAGLPPDRRKHMFAIAFPRGNGGIGFLMMHVLFLREHNRIAGILAAANPGWDDERLFQTTRNILTVVLIKIVIEDYVNHIAPYHFQFRVVRPPYHFQLRRVEHRHIAAPWHRPNWVSMEFYLLYRWHCLVPDTIRLGRRILPIERTLDRPELLIRNGLWDAFVGASREPCGEIGLANTPDFLRSREEASIRLARTARLATYNEYRERFEMPRVTSFEQISGRPAVQDILRRLYGTVDRIELFAGLFAEDTRDNSPLGPLMGRMVGIDAFSQALTNPLLSERVYNEKTFTRQGLEIIDETKTLRQIVERNVLKDFKRTEPKDDTVPLGFTLEDPPRSLPAPQPPPVGDKLVAAFTAASAGAQKALNWPVLPRGAHPRHHVIVKADFRVEPPASDRSLHHGLFAEAGTYPAYVRFSNSGAGREDGKEPDVRGVAIKVMEVGGEKLLDDERSTQDFLLVDHPLFMAWDPVEFFDFMVLRGSQKAGKIRLDELDAHFPIFSPARKFVRSVLTQIYYSQTAARLGRGLVVKYRLHPRVTDTSPLPPEEAGKKAADYLKTDLVSTIRERDVAFDFDVQLFDREATTPIDDPTVEWPTGFTKVATLVIPRQEINDSKARNDFAENISFTPWHSRLEHEPLGRMNAARRDVYLRMLAHRRTTNNVGSFPEPTGKEKL
jgi:prostaglandin-endoperoxide synthase 2